MSPTITAFDKSIGPCLCGCLPSQHSWEPDVAAPGCDNCPDCKGFTAPTPEKRTIADLQAKLTAVQEDLKDCWNNYQDLGHENLKLEDDLRTQLAAEQEVTKQLIAEGNQRAQEFREYRDVALNSHSQLRDAFAAEQQKVERLTGALRDAHRFIFMEHGGTGDTLQRQNVINLPILKEIEAVLESAAAEPQPHEHKWVTEVVRSEGGSFFRRELYDFVGADEDVFCATCQVKAGEVIK